MISKKSSLVDVAFAVCTALDEAGIVAVLVGGSAATYYAPQEYQSDDIDFVIKLEPGGSSGNPILTALGFERRNQMYVHPESRYTVEFPAGPLSVGDETIAHWKTVHRDTEVLHIVSRTDCVRDRLAAYYFWNDAQSLMTALDVARSGEIDLGMIEAWSKKEQQMEKFRRFASKL